MAAEIIYFLPLILGIALFLIGREYKDFMIGFLSGIMFFVYGVALLINPLPTIDALTNTLVATILWGLGAYIMIRSGYEQIKK